MLVLGHGGQLFGQLQRFALQAAAIEKAFQRQSAFPVLGPQFGFGRIVGLDIAKVVRRTPSVEEGSCLLAGGAFRIANKQHYDSYVIGDVNSGV